MLRIAHCPHELWQALCHEDETCTFFQTPDWHRIAARHFQVSPCPLLFSVGKKQAVLPLLKRRKLFFNFFFSPFGTYTDFLTTSRWERDEAQLIEQYLQKRNISLFSSPFGRLKIPLHGPVENATYIIRLSEVDPEKPWKTWRSGHRYNIRAGLKRGVTVRRAESREDWDFYFRLYQETLDRWGDRARVVYPMSLFENIRSDLEEKGKAVLWLAQSENRIISGMLLFYHNRHVAYWHGASSSAHFRLYANQVIFQDIIRHACEGGYRILDFNPGRNLPGVEAYKKGFGAEKIPFTNYENRTPAYNALASLKGLFPGGR